MTKKIFKIFIDFDGTVSTEDVGAAMVNFFGNKEANRLIINDWIDNKLSSSAAWLKMMELFRNVGTDEMKEFIGSFAVDPTFMEFTRFCRENEFEYFILSDGFDFYIEPILQKAGLGHIRFFSNKAQLSPEGQMRPLFPHRDEECAFCANCKRNHIISHSGDEEYTVYIGDGYSDKCPIQYCDFIFAKGALLRYCEINRITFFQYRDFADVQRKMEELNSKKRLKKRHQAELKRKEVYIQG